MALSENYIIQNSTLVDIADAIREKTGSSERLSPSDMVTEIGKIAVGSSTFTLKYVIVSIAGRVTDSANGEWYYYTQVVDQYIKGNNFMLIFDLKSSGNSYTRCEYCPGLTGSTIYDFYTTGKSNGITTLTNGATTTTGFFGNSYSGMRGETHDNRIFIRKNTNAITVAPKGLLIYAEAA